MYGSYHTGDMVVIIQGMYGSYNTRIFCSILQYGSYHTGIWVVIAQGHGYLSYNGYPVVVIMRDMVHLYYGNTVYLMWRICTVFSRNISNKAIR